MSGSQVPERDDDALLRRLRNPALLAAYLFWRTARSGNRLPRLAELDWGGLPGAEHAFTVAIEPAAETIAFRFIKIGRALLPRLGRPMENTRIVVGEEPDSNDEVFGSITAAYRRCVSTSMPSYEYARFDFGDAEPVLFERLVLPASNDGETLTHLIGVALFSGET
jgi:hypothetical protein